MTAGCPDLMPEDRPVGTPEGFAKAVGGAFTLPPLEVAGDLGKAQARWRALLADHLYGVVPEAPDEISVTRHPIPAERAERLAITLSHAGQDFTVHAALWLPEGTTGPVPLICGLDFVGPAGVMSTDSFPLDLNAKVYTRPEFGAHTGRLSACLRGTSMYRWPIPLIHQAGFGVLLSCYGSWVPDDVETCQTHGVCPLMDPDQTGAISLWAWAMQRLVDVAQGLPEVDGARIAIAGHSRLGKAALWAAAQDARISAVFANNSGCGGSAPARHPMGETLEQMAQVYPHWTRPTVATDPAKLPFDQHHLLASIAPRAVYLGNAEDDIWADPVGSYHALRAASTCWLGAKEWPSIEELWLSGRSVQNDALGYHLRPGGHDLLPYDWALFLKFLKTL